MRARLGTAARFCEHAVAIATNKGAGWMSRLQVVRVLGNSRYGWSVESQAFLRWCVSRFRLSATGALVASGS